MSDLQKDFTDFYLKSGTIHINSNFNTQLSDRVIKELLFLDSILEKDIPINILINSHGGDVNDCFSILSIMDMIKSRRVIRCIGIGLVFSAAFSVFINATPGQRVAHIHAIFGTHFARWSNISGSVESIASDDRILLTHNNHIEYLAKKLNKPIDAIKNEFKKDRHFSAQEAFSCGIADTVVLGE